MSVRALPLLPLPHQETHHRLRILNRALVDHLRHLFSRKPSDLDALIFHRSCLPFAEAFGHKDGHALLDIAWAHPKGGELGPLARLIAGLLGELALRGLQWRFAGIETTGGQFPEV